MRWSVPLLLLWSNVVLVGLPREAKGQAVDRSRLASLLTDDGFDPPRRFKAVVGVVTIDQEGPVGTQWFDWRGTSEDRDDWWPASSIKLYAAVAALARSRELGFGVDSRVCFLDEDSSPLRTRLSNIVRRAIVDSDNQAFNRLVEFVGFDLLHRRFFTARNGLQGTVFLRSYGGRRVDPATGYGVNRWSPRIVLSDGERRQTLPERSGTGRYECPDQGNCTTLRQLAETIRRVVLHARLPAHERFDLGDREVSLLHDVLAAPRRRHGALLVESIQRGVGVDVPLRVYHKPGFAYRWSSDVMFIHRTDTGERWVLAAAAWPGRRVLDDALFHLGRVLASRRLSASNR